MSNLIEQITAAHARDQQHRTEEVFAAAELPLCYEAITDEWLSDALCKKHPDAEVTGHRLGAPDNGSSNRRRIFIDYNEVGRNSDLPSALFCKATHDLPNRIVLGLSGAAHSEVTFYNRIRPLLDIEAPLVFFAGYDPQSFNSLIMLDDLTDKVTEFCSHNTHMTRQRAESQMSLLGRLHGPCYQREELKEVLPAFQTWPEYFAATQAFGMKEGSNKGFLAAQEVIPPRLYRRYDEVWPATAASVQRHEVLPQTLAHGDVHLKNWYVAGNGEMGLSDWQCAHRGHWSRDFAYTVSTALTVEDRRAWERDLLRLYLDHLHAERGPAVDFDEAWTHYRQQLMSALTWWTITLTPAPEMPDMQPRDITLEFIRRISTAIDDVDSLDSFSG